MNNHLVDITMSKHDCSVHRFLLYKSNVLWKLPPYHYLPLKLLLNNADPLSYEERSMVISSQYLVTRIVKEKFNHICLNEIYLVILYTLAATNQFAIDIVAATLYLDDTPKELRPVMCFGDGNCLSFNPLQNLTHLYQHVFHLTRSQNKQVKVRISTTVVSKRHGPKGGASLWH